MSFSDNGSMSPADYAAINGNNGFGNFGGDGWWIILLLLLAGNGGWGGFGGFGGGYEMPYFYNQQTQNDVNRGFDNQSVLTALNGIASAIIAAVMTTECPLVPAFLAIIEQAETDAIVMTAE